MITTATLASEVYDSDTFYIKIGKLISRATNLASHAVDRKSIVYKNQTG